MAKIHFIFEKYIRQTVTEDPTITLKAGEVISGHRLLRIGSDGKVYYADKDNFDNMIGMSLNSAVSGGDVEVRTWGRIYLNGWNLTPSVTYYLGNNGYMITNAPISGVLLEVGKALDPNTLLFQPKIPIKVGG